MPATIAGSHLGPDIHANRPAANAAGQPIGAQYSCTTHGLIYQTDGATWSTYATLGTAGAYVAGGTDVAVADGGTGSSTAGGAATNLGLGTGDSPQFTAVNVGHPSDTTLARSSAGVLTVEGNRIFAVGGTDVPIADGGTGASTKAAAFDALSPMTTSGDIIYGGASGTGTRLAKGSDGDVLTLASGVPSWAAGGGGGGSSTLPVFVQTNYAGVNGTTNVLPNTPIAGNRIILGINRLGTSTTTSVSSTNTTWTMAVQFVTGGSCLEIWVGVCAASPGATITYTAGTSNFNSTRAIEISAPALTPTVGATFTAAAATGTLTGITAGHYVVGMATNVNTGATTISYPGGSIGSAGVGIGIDPVIVPLWIAYSPSTYLQANGAGSGTVGIVMAEVS